jgi:hypothetical protein
LFCWSGTCCTIFLKELLIFHLIKKSPLLSNIKIHVYKNWPPPAPMDDDDDDDDGDDNDDNNDNDGHD